MDKGMARGIDTCRGRPGRNGRRRRGQPIQRLPERTLQQIRVRALQCAPAQRPLGAEEAALGDRHPATALGRLERHTQQRVEVRRLPAHEQPVRPIERDGLAVDLLVEPVERGPEREPAVLGDHEVVGRQPAHDQMQLGEHPPDPLRRVREVNIDPNLGHARTIWPTRGARRLATRTHSTTHKYDR